MIFGRPASRHQRFEGVMRAFSVRLRRRAWSRAGAVAAVVSQGVPRRVLSLSSRIALFVLGVFTVSVSVATTIWNDLGPGPLDVFIGAVRERTGLPMSIAVWVTVGALIAAAWLLGRRPGVGTFASPILMGPMLQAVLTGLEMFEPPPSVAVRVVLHLVAIAGIGVGLGMLIVSGLGTGSGELFAGATSDRVGQPVSRVRPMIELSWIVLGVALGGPAGVGTILVAALIAPAVSRGYRVVDSLVGRSVGGLRQTHQAMTWCEITALEREYELTRR
jgi:uncharacterized membrane protein YczE